MSLNLLSYDNCEYESPDNLIEELQQIPRGDEGWRDYQALGIQIFNHLFVPDFLGEPFVQWILDADGVYDSSTSKRPDAVYPIVGDDFINGHS